MAKKKLNTRCPLQAECERKCTYEGHELDCDYYFNNAVGEDRTIEDQELIRAEREREVYEAEYEAELAAVDEEDHSPDATKMVYLPIDRLHPHPDNPRKELGDLTELADSIRANGIYQNLTVVPDDPTSPSTDFTVVIGHRRLAASTSAGLTHVPCVIVEMTPKEQIQTMLLENMQRSDLTVYEQAQGFQMMLDMGSTVEEIAEKSGFSATTVRRRVKMMELDQKTLKEVSSRQLTLSDFDKLSQIEDIKERNECLEKIGTYDFNQAVASRLRRQVIKAKLPDVKKFLKGVSAKSLKQSETWSGKYDRVGATFYLYEHELETLAVPKGLDGKVYYCLDEQYGSLNFYQERKKAAPVKRSAEEIEREKRIAAAWEKAKEVEAIAFKLRSEFVEGLHLNSKNMTLMLKGALSSSILRCIDYESANRTLLVNTLKLNDEVYGTERAYNALDAFAKANTKDYPTIIYANFNDGDSRGYTYGYKGAWPTHKKSAILDALYEWLCSLGYEMSAEEKAMQDGSHEVFKGGLEEKAKESEEE